MADDRGSLDDRRSLVEVAEARLDNAIAETEVLDPRDIYRQRLRYLRERDQSAFDEARKFYETELLPRVAEPDSDPLFEWLEYGRRLMELEGSDRGGRTVAIDQSGRSTDFVPPLRPDHLVIFLPEENRIPALALNTPLRLSPVQAANHALLIEGKLRLTDS